MGRTGGLAEEGALPMHGFPPRQLGSKHGRKLSTSTKQHCTTNECKKSVIPFSRPPDWCLCLPGDGEAEGAVCHALAVQVLRQAHNEEVRHAFENLETHLRRLQGRT